MILPEGIREGVCQLFMDVATAAFASYTSVTWADKKNKNPSIAFHFSTWIQIVTKCALDPTRVQYASNSRYAQSIKPL